MLKKNYIIKLNNKEKLNKTKFKSINININDVSLNVKTYIMSFSDFKEYIEGLINIENNICYLIKKIFILKMEKTRNNFDILVLNSKLEIVDILSNYNKNSDDIFFQNPMSLLIMPKNSIKYHNLRIGQKIKLSKFIY